MSSIKNKIRRMVMVKFCKIGSYLNTFVLIIICMIHHYILIGTIKHVLFVVMGL